jgi:hypothetical protein
LLKPRAAACCEMAEIGHPLKMAVLSDARAVWRLLRSLDD